LRNSEKKSFIVIFSISLITFIVLGFMIFYLYYKENKDHIKEDILYRMKEYAFDFKDKEFKLDIIKKEKNVKFFKIYISIDGLYSYYKFPKNDKLILKVTYNKDKFAKDLSILIDKVLKLAVMYMILSLLFSILFAFYAIKPMKKSIDLLEIFLKDLIHDLNTPVTSILLNVKLLSRQNESDELERIELSAKNISSLYKNLEILKNKQLSKDDIVEIKVLISERVEVLKKIYPKIKIIETLIPLHVKSNKNAISRILDNILTNACKYNKKNGKVFISTNKNMVEIRDTGIGIKNPKKVFERYYKENERGLGIGMNIVKKLCDELDIKIIIDSEIDIGTTIKLTFN